MLFLDEPFVLRTAPAETGAAAPSIAGIPITSHSFDHDVEIFDIPSGGMVTANLDLPPDKIEEILAGRVSCRVKGVITYNDELKRDLFQYACVEYRSKLKEFRPCPEKRSLFNLFSPSHPR